MPNDLTPARRAELRAELAADLELAARASPPPWTYRFSPDCDHSHSVMGAISVDGSATSIAHSVWASGGPNMQLCAAARTRLPAIAQAALALLDGYERLEAAIREHHAQKADDRCWQDDSKLYAAAGLPASDRRVGDKSVMLANCQRFLLQRCEGGGPWKSYAETETENARLRDHCAGLEGALRSLASYLSVGGYNAPAVDPAVFEAKIRDGIDYAVGAEVARLTAESAEQARQLSECHAELRFIAGCPMADRCDECSKRAAALLRRHQQAEGES